MSMMGYGAIALKNGKMISDPCLFTDMEKTVGFSDLDEPLPMMNGWSFDGNYFVVLGKKDDIIIGFYKTEMRWWRTWKDEYAADAIKFETGDEWFCSTPYSGWKEWNKYCGDVLVTVKPRNGYYVATFDYCGDHYKVYFGYGVDAEFYAKWHVVNYYRSIHHLCGNIKYSVKRIGINVGNKVEKTIQNARDAHWVNAKKRLPNNEELVLLLIRNELGDLEFSFGCYTDGEHTRNESKLDFDPQDLVYDPQKQDYIVPAGWWDDSWIFNYDKKTECGSVIKWKRLPEDCRDLLNITGEMKKIQK